MHSTYGCAVVSVKPGLRWTRLHKTTLPWDPSHQSGGARDHPHFRPADYKFRCPLGSQSSGKCYTLDYRFITVKGYTLTVKAKEDLHGRESRALQVQSSGGPLWGQEGQSRLLLVGMCSPPMFYWVSNVFKMFIKSIPIDKWRIYHSATEYTMWFCLWVSVY